jgi:hypothetical protein
VLGDHNQPGAMAKPEEKTEDGPPKKDNKEGLPEVRGCRHRL